MNENMMWELCGAFLILLACYISHVYLSRLQKRAAKTVTEMEQVCQSNSTALLGSHPEDTCKKCKGPNITWFAPSELWNKYHGGYDILCPVCFAKMAEKEGCVPTAWAIAPEAI